MTWNCFARLNRRRLVSGLNAAGFLKRPSYRDRKVSDLERLAQHGLRRDERALGVGNGGSAMTTQQSDDVNTTYVAPAICNLVGLHQDLAMWKPSTRPLRPPRPIGKLSFETKLECVGSKVFGLRTYVQDRFDKMLDPARYAGHQDFVPKQS